MDKSAATDCLAIPVSGAMVTYEEPEAILFGLVYGMAIGKGHAELADALIARGVDILACAEGSVPDEAYRARFNDQMNDIIEVMTVMLV